MVDKKATSNSSVKVIPSLEEIFLPGGLLSESLAGYEERPQQLKMALAVENAILEEKHLIVEAGTGIGKSIAYLIPFILWATQQKKKVIVSTYTKALQEQLTEKDLPFLKQILPVEFEFALCLGSENYLCLRKLNQAWQHDFFEQRGEIDQLVKISEWKKQTKNGSILELDFQPLEKVWSEICRESDLCYGKKCSFYGECFYQGARIKQNKAQILVVNHHLFFTNISAGGRVLPNYDAVVFDEAQNLEDVAAEYLGIEISNFTLKRLFDRLYNPAKEKGLLKRIGISEKTREEIINDINHCRNESERFFSLILDRFGPESITKRIRTQNFVENILEYPLSVLGLRLKKILDVLKEEKEIHEVDVYANRCLALKEGLKAIIEQSLEEYVYWLEIVYREKGYRCVLHASPINIAPLMKEKIFDVTFPCVLTSATLATNKAFDFIEERIGLEGCSELLLDSPFDYKKQALLYCSEKIADPTHEWEKFENEAMEKVREILEISRGRTFVLFTSYDLLRKTYDYLLNYGIEVNLLRQGDAPSWKMLEDFKNNQNSVLLGTSTFWQGVDVPGKALECVIITKLPFAVPDDPITEARIEFLSAQGKDAFIHYQIPQAIIMLKQGFGRLIRTKTDRGIVAILDPRIKTRYYGKFFLNSLPSCSIIDELEKIKLFLQAT